MNNTHKIIIACLIGVIIILGGAIAGSLLKEPTKTVELFENGTTIDVPASSRLNPNAAQPGIMNEAPTAPAPPVAAATAAAIAGPPLSSRVPKPINEKPKIFFVKDARKLS